MTTQQESFNPQGDLQQVAQLQYPPIINSSRQQLNVFKSISPVKLRRDQDSLSNQNLEEGEGMHKRFNSVNNSMIHIGGSRNGFLTSVNGDSITKGSGTIDYSSLAVPNMEYPRKNYKNYNQKMLLASIQKQVSEKDDYKSDPLGHSRMAQTLKQRFKSNWIGSPDAPEEPENKSSTQRAQSLEQRKKPNYHYRNQPQNNKFEIDLDWEKKFQEQKQRIMELQEMQRNLDSEYASESKMERQSNSIRSKLPQIYTKNFRNHRGLLSNYHPASSAFSGTNTKGFQITQDPLIEVKEQELLTKEETDKIIKEMKANHVHLGDGYEMPKESVIHTEYKFIEPKERAKSMRKQDKDPILQGPPVQELPEKISAYNILHNRSTSLVDARGTQWNHDQNKFYKKRLLNHQSSLGEDDSPDNRQSIVNMDYKFYEEVDKNFKESIKRQEENKKIIEKQHFKVTQVSSNQSDHIGFYRKSLYVVPKVEKPEHSDLHQTLKKSSIHMGNEVGVPNSSNSMSFQSNDKARHIYQNSKKEFAANQTQAWAGTMFQGKRNSLPDQSASSTQGLVRALRNDY